MKYIFFLCFSAMTIAFSPAWSNDVFDFQKVASLKEMEKIVVNQFDVGTEKHVLRRKLVEQGNATLVSHPTLPHTEKYIYDINLCKLYVWRWNISVDYDANDTVKQLFVNGVPMLPKGPLPNQTFPDNEKTLVAIGRRQRPEATHGEKILSFVLFDADQNLKTVDDQFISGAGPSRADPNNFGTAFPYGPVDQWRSIFDTDAADFIADYAGKCP